MRVLVVQPPPRIPAVQRDESGAEIWISDRDSGPRRDAARGDAGASRTTVDDPEFARSRPWQPLAVDDHTDPGPGVPRAHGTIPPVFSELRGMIADAGLVPRSDDVLLLPENLTPQASSADYEDGVSRLARALGCYVVGGSHRESRAHGGVNYGVVADPAGRVLGGYEKLRPYGKEVGLVTPGSTLGEFDIGGRKVVVLICADFWFSDLFSRIRRLPDMVLVPAMSVSRKPSPDYARSLWRHLAISRAYEFGVFVGISDWAHPPGAARPSCSGVAGFADPTVADPSRLFTPLGDYRVRAFEPDFAELYRFRGDRVARGFFWKSGTRDPHSSGSQTSAS